MPLVETARATLFIKDYRKKGFTGTPIIIIHGAGGMYQDTPSQLRRDLQCIALDLAGHGRSPEPSRTTITDNTADIVALMDTLSIKRTILIGHSMGGAIAQQLALDFPDRVAGLVLLGTAAKLKVSSQIINGIINHTEATAQLIMNWMWADGVPEHYIEQGIERLLDLPAEVIQRDYIACNHFDVRDRLQEITVPVLVVAGSADKMVNPVWSEYLADNISNATYKVLADAGHMFPLEQPQQLVIILQQWMTNLYDI